MAPVRRYDSGGTLAPPTRLPNGWLRAEGLPTRVGIFNYRLPDGRIRKELRLPEEVFHPDSMASFRSVPITSEHPPEHLTAANTRLYQRGHVDGEVVRDGDYVRATLLVTDDELIRDMESGVRAELSNGYACELGETPGLWEGQPYDAIQRNIRGNHLAVVTAGRAGPTCAVRMDACDAVQVTPDVDMAGGAAVPSEAASSPTSEGVAMETVPVIIGGKAYAVPKDVAEALTAQAAQYQQALDAAKEETETAKEESATQVEEAKKATDTANAKADSLARELEAMKKARQDAEDPVKLRERVQARVCLEKRSGAVLGAAVKMDALDDKAVKLAVLGKLAPDVKLDGKSDDYVQALFDMEVARFEKDRGSLHADAAAAPPGDAPSPRAAYEKTLTSSWKRDSARK
ncbi:DUF2213 domain-containing protein [Corallococcus exiguus]|uniref:DUF2213 domain-containing protein n=1 Tax=Corallococcus exiguus TaxID=83462 RepID=UPI001A8EBAB9|nr:DUF2213 domain-containing protein [Corallococcus exiguus]MBN8472339.1 DUF2213 domain-containing protein [Corallococcus exiguus]